MASEKKKGLNTTANKIFETLISLILILSKDFQSLGLIRECREMVGASLTRPELSLRAKRCMGGRNCHRKHVENG